MNKSDEEFIEWLEGYNNWYEHQSAKWSSILSVCKIATFTSSFISIVLAASVTKEVFESWGKWLIVAGTLLSALSSELLGQFQVRRMEDLRETGNLETAHLLSYAKQKFDEFTDNREQINKIKDDIRARILALEQSQHRQFVDIDGGGAISRKSRPPASN